MIPLHELKKKILALQSAISFIQLFWENLCPVLIQLFFPLIDLFYFSNNFSSSLKLARPEWLHYLFSSSVHMSYFFRAIVYKLEHSWTRSPKLLKVVQEFIFEKDI